MITCPLWEPRLETEVHHSCVLFYMLYLLTSAPSSRNTDGQSGWSVASFNVSFSHHMVTKFIYMCVCVCTLNSGSVKAFKFEVAWEEKSALATHVRLDSPFSKQAAFTPDR